MSMVPDEKSFIFEITGGNGVIYEAFLSLEGEYQTEGAIRYIDCRYREKGKDTREWTWLIGPDLGGTTTEDATNTSVDACLAVINSKIIEQFGEGGNSPEKPINGYQLVLWLLKNGLQVSNNVISRK